MASIHKRKKSPFWTASYTSRDGRQLKKSTKTTDKNQATEIAIELGQALPVSGAGILDALIGVMHQLGGRPIVLQVHVQRPSGSGVS